MRHHFLFLLGFAAITSCSTSDNNPIIDFGEGEGITYRTAQNVPIGPRDYSDWTSDATWNKQERALFPDLSFDLNGTQRPTIITETSVYPNPSYGGTANWTMSTRPGGTQPNLPTMQAVLVSRRYDVVSRFGPAYIFGSFTHTLAYQPRVPANELYRLYYVVYDASGLVYKGHGDVRYSPQ